MSRAALFAGLCRLFCCPPMPSRIAGKLAFLPPKPPSYKLERDELLMLAEGGVYRQRTYPPGVTLHRFRSKSRNNICAFHIACPSGEPRYTFLYSHANAVDIGQMLDFLLHLAAELQCNFFIYDYSGYGESTGVPTESNACKDAVAAYQYLRSTLEVPAEELVLYGQSIGSGPSVYLATHQSAAALILHSPLMSGLRVLTNVDKTYWCDIFPNIDRIKEVDMPVLIIQGTDDEVIDIVHGISLHDAAPRPLEPLWVEGAGHNDVEMHHEYVERMRHFVETLT